MFASAKFQFYNMLTTLELQLYKVVTTGRLMYWENKLCTVKRIIITKMVNVVFLSHHLHPKYCTCVYIANFVLSYTL